MFCECFANVLRMFFLVVTKNFSYFCNDKHIGIYYETKNHYLIIGIIFADHLFCSTQSKQCGKHWNSHEC